VTILLNLR